MATQKREQKRRFEERLITLRLKKSREKNYLLQEKRTDASEQRSKVPAEG